MNYEVRLPPMPKGRCEFKANGQGGKGLLGYVLEHDGEFIQCVCDNWPFPKFAFSRGFGGTPIKSHLAATWKVAASPNYASYDEAIRQSLGWSDEPLILPIGPSA